MFRLVELVRVSFYLAAIGVGFLVSGCTPMPIAGDGFPPVASSGVAKNSPGRIPVKVTTGCQGMLDYYDLFSLMEKQGRVLELDDMQQHLADSDDNCTRLKLGMVLSQPNTTVQDDKLAEKLLTEFTNFSGLVDTQDQLLAELILDDIKERRRIKQEQLSKFNKIIKIGNKKRAQARSTESDDEQSALQVLARENETLRKKLEQLSDIEKTLGEKEQAIVKPIVSPGQ